MFWENNIVSADGWKIKKFEKICVKHENIESLSGSATYANFEVVGFFIKSDEIFCLSSKCESCFGLPPKQSLRDMYIPFHKKVCAILGTNLIVGNNL